LSRNSGASASWKPKGLFRPVVGTLYLYPYYGRIYLEKNKKVAGNPRAFGVPAKVGQVNMPNKNSQPYISVLSERESEIMFSIMTLSLILCSPQSQTEL
jgi:hypothetical protein